jgi:hypothetical protein
MPDRYDVSFSRWAKGAAFRLPGLLPVNCEAELRVTCYLNGRIQEAKTDSRAKFGKESIPGAQEAKIGSTL